MKLIAAAFMALVCTFTASAANWTHRLATVSEISGCAAGAFDAWTTVRAIDIGAVETNGAYMSHNAAGVNVLSVRKLILIKSILFVVPIVASQLTRKFSAANAVQLTLIAPSALFTIQGTWAGFHNLGVYDTQKEINRQASLANSTP
jgi:hypothetical protein